MNAAAKTDGDGDADADKNHQPWSTDLGHQRETADCNSPERSSPQSCDVEPVGGEFTQVLVSPQLALLRPG